MHEVLADREGNEFCVIEPGRTFFELSIKLDLTTRQLKSMAATYPSVGSDLGSML